MKSEPIDVAVVGAGPTGLMAAEIAARAGRRVTIFDRMRLPGRKFLLAGADGLNLTYDSASLDAFASRYEGNAIIRNLLAQFGPQDLRVWADGLGAETFCGSSGRVFPRQMKASPLLRAWLARLDTLGVTFRGNSQLSSWDRHCLVFASGQSIAAKTTVLALGGASWPKMGTDGTWLSLFAPDAVTALRPSNCRFPLRWSDHIVSKFEGQPIKNIAVQANRGWSHGDLTIVRQGLEGGPIYGTSAHWQAAQHTIIDLLPHRTATWVAQKWAKVPTKLSLASKLKRLNVPATATALLQELRHKHRELLRWPQCLKQLCIPLDHPPTFERAISTAGGLKWSNLTPNLRYKGRERTYIGGEMLDWDAPTGGFLLQACFSMGFVIGQAIANEHSSPMNEI